MHSWVSVFYVDGKPIEFELKKFYSHLGHIINVRLEDADNICLVLS